MSRTKWNTHISASKDRGTVVEERPKRVQEQKFGWAQGHVSSGHYTYELTVIVAAYVRPIPALCQTQFLPWEGSWEWQELMNMNPQFWRNKAVVRGGSHGLCLGWSDNWHLHSTSDNVLCDFSSGCICGVRDQEIYLSRVVTQPSQKAALCISVLFPSAFHIDILGLSSYFCQEMKCWYNKQVLFTSLSSSRNAGDSKQQLD